MEILDFFLQLISAEKGILAAGWAISIYLAYRMLTKKDAVAEDSKTVAAQHAADIKTVRESLEKELQDLRIAHSAELAELRKAHDVRIDEIEDDLEGRLKETSGRLHYMNDTHIKLITDMSERRIEDIKSLNEDYNAMAESVRLAIEKLAQSLSKKR